MNERLDQLSGAFKRLPQVLAAWSGPGRWWACGAVVARRLSFEPLYRWLRK